MDALDDPVYVGFEETQTSDDDDSNMFDWTVGVNSQNASDDVDSNMFDWTVGSLMQVRYSKKISY